MCNRKPFQWYYAFSSQMRHLCASLCILVYKNADVDNFYWKSLRSMAKLFSTDLNVIIMCFVELKIFSVILHIFLTNEIPLWFTLYFGIQQCWHWQFLLTIDEGYGQSFYTGLKCYYNVFCGTGNIFSDITHFPHKCATFLLPFVFWYTKMLTLTIFTGNLWGVWLKCLVQI